MRQSHSLFLEEFPKYRILYSRKYCESLTNYIDKLGVLGMKKESLAEVLWKTLVMGETTSDESKKQEVSNIELLIMNKKNDC